MKLKNITAEDLKNDEFLTTCECGNVTHIDYSWTDNDGIVSCPQCMVNWQQSQIDIYKKLTRDLADPKLTESDIKNVILHEFSKILALPVEDLEDSEFL